MPEPDVPSAYVTPGAALGDAGGTWIVGGGVCADTATISAAASRETDETRAITVAPPCAGAVRARTPPGRVLRCRPCGTPGQARSTLRPCRARARLRARARRCLPRPAPCAPARCRGLPT